MHTKNYPNGSFRRVLKVLVKCKFFLTKLEIFIAKLKICCMNTKVAMA